MILSSISSGALISFVAAPAALAVLLLSGWRADREKRRQRQWVRDRRY